MEKKRRRIMAIVMYLVYVFAAIGATVTLVFVVSSIGLYMQGNSTSFDDYAVKEEIEQNREEGEDVYITFLLTSDEKFEAALFYKNGVMDKKQNFLAKQNSQEVDGKQCAIFSAYVRVGMPVTFGIASDKKVEIANLPSRVAERTWWNAVLKHLF